MSDKANILFVDDEKRVLNSMRGLFRRDFELFLTTEGANAVQIATENSIDVIVADQRMPGMTGIEVLGKVKELSPRTVRILLTGYADPAAVEGSINIGEVFRFLSKPCPPKVLRETLELAIAASRAAPPVLEAKPLSRPAPAEPATVQPAAPESAQPTVESAAEPAARPRRADIAAPPRIGPMPVASPTDPNMPADTSMEANRPAETPPAATPIRPVDSPEPPVVASDETMPPGDPGNPTHWKSVTEVVMSGDTSQINRQLEIESAATSNSKDIGVVLFTIDSEFAEAAMRAVSADRSTILATTLGKVAETIEQRQAGVLITDFTTNRAVLQKMISALKQHLPELVTIVVSDGRDTTDMINLINHGQVFRYIMKPIDPQDLRNDINSAASRHVYLLNNPQALLRHEVVKAAALPDASPTLDQFVSRIQKLRTQRSGNSG